MELKKALAKTRQDLQKTRSRRQSQDNRSSSDEVSTPSLSCLSLTDGISHSLVSVCYLFQVFFMSFKPCLNNAWHMTLPGSCLLSLSELQLLKTFSPLILLPGSASGHSRLCEHCLHKDNAAARNPRSSNRF